MSKLFEKWDEIRLRAQIKVLARGKVSKLLERVVSYSWGGYGVAHACRFVVVDLCMLRMRMTYIVPRPRHMPACCVHVCVEHAGHAYTHMLVF